LFPNHQSASRQHSYTRGRERQLHSSNTNNITSNENHDGTRCEKVASPGGPTDEVPVRVGHTCCLGKGITEYAARLAFALRTRLWRGDERPSWQPALERTQLPLLSKDQTPLLCCLHIRTHTRIMSTS
jgi:hypothetical protein